MTNEPSTPTPALEHAESLFHEFRREIEMQVEHGTLGDNVIGKGLLVDGPEGPVKLIYADYAASGRAHRAVEHFVMDHVLPVYANPHTQASHCGRSINALRRHARAQIAAYCEADERDAVIFAGSGATAGIHKLVRLLGADSHDGQGRPALVLHGPYEHHSNLLPWRECGAEVVEVPEGVRGGPDRAFLERRLLEAQGRRIIATFSAGSNVTGVLSDVPALSRLVQQHGGAVIWDYAGAAPYRPMSMHPAPDVHIDALVCSPHKFVGGPGASGILVVRKDAVVIERPSAPGGGTVSFVSPSAQDYHCDLAAREEAGTPNVVGDIRAALVLTVRDCLANAGGDEKAAAMRRAAVEVWGRNPLIEILGPDQGEALPIVSIRVRDRAGGFVHHQLVTLILSDWFGIQARGGCACAGPYVHRLLGIEEEQSQAIRRAIGNEEELEKPGFVRVNFSSLMDQDEFDLLIEAVGRVACESERFARHYVADPKTAVFESVPITQPVGNLGKQAAGKYP
ncbi:MAG: aminotransferase class V-fold PLP-dependent enzyme [Erythrobacter sp.]